MNRDIRGVLARRALLGGLTALLLLPALAHGQSIEDKYRRAKEQSSRFNLASGPTAVLQTNKFQCGLTNTGQVCTDVFGSPTGGGGFWPTGTPDQYMFASGLQVLGIIPGNAGFAWAGDTVGAFFNEGTGSRLHGSPVTEIYDSQNPDDLAIWPDAGSFASLGFPEASAWVRDTTLFNDVLIGRKAASQQDTWTMYWDGDPAKVNGRTHPMGILVEQRSLAWNYPDGNEAIIYFIYKFTNVTNNPTFQSLNEVKYFGGANMLPDAGWRIDSIYVASDSDADVDASKANSNYATGILPFNLGLAYLNTFFEPAFDYPPSEFHPPFFPNAVGILGVKFLKSPIDVATGQEVGLTSLSLHTNGGAFPDPSTVQRGWRYVSLNVDAGKGDANCSFPLSEVKARRACYLGQTASDVRFFIGSGPFSLDPGQSATVAIAMYAAATVNTPLIQITADNKPGFPSIRPGCGSEPIRPIEVASGWVRTRNCPSDPAEAVSQFEVDVVRNSLLGKALVAQAIFDNKFLLGFSPESPTFHLVPGDNQVTVLWDPSRTEVEGDPFFVAAGDPGSPLYDPNYRNLDVEGYRIYRGTTPGNLRLIAQFDKAGSVFVDSLCLTDPTYVAGDPCDDVTEVELSGPFVQYPAGGVVKLADGSTLVVKADTALSAQIATAAAKPLTDTGIPFAYVDKDVRDGFQYFYKVTAFDINSLKSGPSSLESAGQALPVTPRKSSTNEVLAAFQSKLSGSDGVALNPTGPLPTIGANTGMFSGPMPPTNGIEAAFAPLVERLLPAFTLTARIDSIKPDFDVNNGCPNGSNAVGACWHMFVTFDKDGAKTQTKIDGYTPAWQAFGEPQETDFTLGAVPVPADATALQQFGIPAGTVSFNATLTGQFWESIGSSAFEGESNRRMGGNGVPARLVAGGSRWFSGTNETVAHPTIFTRVGHLQGVDTVWAAIHHTPPVAGGAQYAGSTAMQCFPYSVSALSRAADLQLTWGANGAATVRDVTHNVDVSFKPTAQASFGFLNADGNGNGVIDWADFHYISNVSAGIEDIGFCNHADDPSTRTQLEQTPRIQAVSVSGANNATPAGIAQTGMGFGLYINGEAYIFQLATLPASGTTWTLRTYAGYVQSQANTTATPNSYTFASQVRPPMVPGLTVTFASESATQLVGDPDLAQVHTVPDPYYATSQFDLSPASKQLKFVNLPPTATIRIYSMSGVLVTILTHDDPTNGGLETWNLRNRSQQYVASGVYFYHVSTPDGKSRVGKFTVINSGFAR